MPPQQSAPPPLVYPLQLKPGIQIDGTTLSHACWNEGINIRFQRGLPRKIGGWKAIVGATPLILKFVDGSQVPLNFTSRIQNLFLFNKPPDPFFQPVDPNQPIQKAPTVPLYYLYICTQSGIGFVIIDQNGVIQNNTFYDRTPGNYGNNTWNTNNPYRAQYVWTVRQYANPNLDPLSQNPYFIIVTAIPNRLNISQTFKSPIWFAHMDQSYNRPLMPFSASFGGTSNPVAQYTAGGIIAVGIYLFSFDTGGEITIYDPENPQSIIFQSPITDKKIIAAAPTRGGNSSPAALFWTEDSLIRATLTGNPEDPANLFSFDTISTEVSLLSADCIQEFDGIYYWQGNRVFQMYNGTVQTIPNNNNINYYFDNADLSNLGRAFSQKVKRFGEVWWFLPQANFDANLHMMINKYNVYDKTWTSDFYNGSPINSILDRNTATYSESFPYPIMGDLHPFTSNIHGIYMHEFGTDIQYETQKQPIFSAIRTNYINWMIQGRGNVSTGTDRWSRLDRVELDLIQVGSMTLRITGQNYSRSTSTTSDSSYIFDATQEKIDMREQGRYLQLSFESNVIGGFFEIGLPLLTLRTGDGRQ